MNKLSALTFKVKEVLKLLCFENKVHPLTWKNHNSIFDSVINIEQDPELTSQNDVLCQEAKVLKDKLLLDYKDKYSDLEGLRVLVHIPPIEMSAGGHSVFNNMVESLKYIGIPAVALPWKHNLQVILDEFKPTIFLTSNNTVYLENINWIDIRKYKDSNKLLIGLSASPDDFANPHLDRLNWIRSNSIDFFFGFRSEEYFLERRENYAPILDSGYSIFSWEFGANVMAYYPVNNPVKDLNYVFLASSNSDKRERYLAWLTKLVKKYPGFINGPGWFKINKNLPQKAHKHIYARAKIGINLHIDDSIKWPSELNERTYILAASGVPQLIDDAKLLDRRFDVKGFFVASSPEEYFTLFEYALNNPEEARDRALIALKEVYDRHTTFHRAEKFVSYLLARNERL